jgi:Gram-negative bacterial TonB protein C-terminal
MRQTCAVLVLLLVAPLTALRAQGKPPVTPPRLISLPTPDCGAGKPCHGTHGQVRLIIDVLETGKAGDIRAELGDGVLVEAATAAAQQAEFVPGSYFGKPVMMNYVLTLRF